MIFDSKEIMSVPFLTMEASVGHAEEVFRKHALFSLPVLDADGSFVGILCLKKVFLAAAAETNPEHCIADMIYKVKPLSVTARVDSINTTNYSDIIPVVDEENRYLGFVETSRIAHKINRYYRQLAERERKLLEASYNGVLAVDSSGTITVFNPAAERILGRKRADVVGQHISQLDPQMGLMDSVERMEPMTGIHTEINGAKILANRTPLIYEGVCTGAVSFFLDVSEYESVCSELKASKTLTKELDAIFESSYDGFYIADHEGRVTRVNSAWERICGFPRAEVVGKRAHELVGQDWYDKSAAVAALSQKKTVTLLVNLTSGPRKGNQVMATGTPVFDDSGNIIQVVVNVRDMTDLEQLQRRLEATEELNQRYASELEQIRLQQLKMDDLVAKSPAMKRVVEMAARIATVDSTLLIMGESGVGKEVITNKIHALSRRKSQPFIKINCGAIPENLLESELFGYAGGAFTGAKREGKPGMFELASNGTLFLDEICELSLGLQVILLRVLQEKTLVRVGGVKSIPVDVRVIAATNRDLQAMVKAGTFRDDLYYRLNVFGIQIPPLRERREDLPPLLHDLLHKFNLKYGVQKRLAPGTVEKLLNYDWPGNVREMENLMERLVVLVNEPCIEIGHLPENMQAKKETSGVDRDAVMLNRIIPYKQAVEELETLLLERAFGEHGSTRKMARVLGVNQSTIVRKMKQYQLARFDA